MNKAGKILIRGACGAGILIFLLAAAAVLLPYFYDTDSIGQNLASGIEARYHIRSERIQISFLPFPRLILYGVRTTVPETLTASVETVVIHPKVLPLFEGKFAPSQIDLLNPIISARLPEHMSEDPAKSASQRLLLLQEGASQFKALLIALIPDVVIDVRNGGLELYCGQDRTFFFEEVDLKSSVHAQRVDFELTSGRSNLWQALSLSGRVDLGTLRSSAELSLTGGNPGDLIKYLNKSTSDSIGDSHIDLHLTLSTNGPESARADFTASIPRFALDGGAQNPRGPLSTSISTPGSSKEGDRQNMVWSNGSLAGSLSIDSSGIDIAISHFQFDYPRVNLTGNFTLKQSDQSVILNVEGRETDVATVHNALLAAIKENKVIRRIFEIIREGQIPEILFSARANNIHDLMKPENLSIKGSIEKGIVFAPKADLLVSKVSGNVSIEGGVLSATNLSGQTRGSSTSGGELKIGLPREDLTFHLDLPITADLSELPEVLDRVVESPVCQQELARIKDVTGKAQGRLIIGEKLHALTVRVETGPFQIFGRYGHLPEPVELKGASFFLGKTKVSIESLAAKSGSSSFDRVDLSYDWGEAKVMEINSQARSIISMDLLGPILRAHEYVKNFVETPPQGLLAFDSFKFTGPPADQSKWVLNGSGSIDHVVFNDKRVNSPLTLNSGMFEIDGDQITLRDVKAAVSDSSLSISGSIAGFLDRAKKVDLQLSGQLGPQSNKIAASLAGFPPSLRAISNLNLLSSRLTWEKDSKTVFKGEMELSAGPHITISLFKTPQELSIEDLVIKDEESDATISINSTHNQLKVGFSGTLSNKTADRLLTDNTLLTGPVGGKFRANLYLDTPEKSSARGKVKISGFELPVNLGAAARIEHAEIEADGNRLNVKSAMISWQGSRLSLIGSVSMAQGAYLVDMNAFADSFDLESILRRREDPGHKEEGDLAQTGLRSSPKGWDAPFRGTIRVRTDSLSYGKVSWNPADADIVLNPGSIDVRLNQANLCTISTPGSIRITPEGLDISVKLSAKDQDLESTLACLFNKKHILSGSYTLTGNLAAKGVSDDLINSLEGDVELKAKDGRIYRFETLSKIISLLSISEVYRGVFPDLTGEGCTYKSLEAKGKIKDGKLILSDSVVNGPCMKMVFRGEIDLVRQKVDVIAMVAPQRTVQRMVDATPIIGKVLDDCFVTLPVRISGDLADPSVVLLSPSAVVEELFGVMKRVCKLPFTIFQPGAEKE